MKIETYLYEILIRGLPDGTISGAHVIYMERYLSDTGEMVAEKPSPAQKVDVKQLQTILGTELANALTQLPQAIAERDAAVAAKTTAIDTFTKAMVEGLDTLHKLK